MRHIVKLLEVMRVLRNNLVKKEVVVKPMGLFDENKLIDLLTQASNANEDTAYSVIREALNPEYANKIPQTPLPYEDLTKDEMAHLLNSDNETRIKEIPTSFFSKLWRRK